MNVTKQFEAQLTTDWAGIPALSEFRVIATERTLDRFVKPTALIRMGSIGPNAAAPQSHRDVGVLLTIVSELEDLDRAAEQLEAAVFAVLDYLDPRFLHEEAKSVAYGNRLAYDIPLTIVSEKD